MANRSGSALGQRNAKPTAADLYYSTHGLSKLKLKYLNDDKRYKKAISKLENNRQYSLNDHEVSLLTSMEGILVDKAKLHAVYIYKGSLYNANDKKPTKEKPNLPDDGFATPAYDLFTRPLVNRRQSLHATTGCDIRQGVCGLISTKIQEYMKYHLKQGFKKDDIDKMLIREAGPVIYNWA